jgi:hypothetical protein
MTAEVDRVVSDTVLSVDAVIPENKVWLCPVCGIKRNQGNHAKCSKITQLKHQQEHDKQSGKNAAT